MGKIHDRLKARGARRNQLDALAKGKAKFQQLDPPHPPPDVLSTDQYRGVPRKGHKDELCNRTACQKPGAYYFNTGTRAYYCLDCACQIRPWGLPDFDLFPGLEPDEREDERVKAWWDERARWVAARGNSVQAERRASELFRT